MAQSGTRRARLPAVTVLRLLVPLSGPRVLAILGVLILAGGILPNTLILALGWLVARIETPGTDLGTLVAPLVLVGLTFVASNVHGPVMNALGSTLGQRFDTGLRDDAMRAASGPAGIAHLEDPRTTDRLIHIEELLHGWLTSRGVMGLAAAWTGRLRGLIAAGILATFAWWAPLLVYTGYRAQRAYSMQTGFLFLQRYESNTQSLRRASYLRGLLHSGQAGKETRVFGISGWFIDAFRRHFEAGMTDVWRDRLRHEVTLFPVVAAVAVSLGYVAAQVGLAAAAGTITVAAAVVAIQAIFGMAGFGPQGDPEWQMHFGAHRAREARRLAQTVRTPESDLRGSLTPEPLARTIRFERVAFAYPGQEERVLDGVDLEIPAGRSIAIVGENGAGKTTIIKLLCRLYDPTSGRVTIDGIGLGDLDPAAWRRQIGVIFQDFVRYELPARENIGVGAIGRAGDTAALERAARLAGANEFLDRIGWEAPLSRRYEGGVDLSGGEWQRIALARALFAVEGGARLLILDEPTANLDVRAEAALYERFLEITRGVTTILISHRFSTVRMADLIVVLEGGRIVERGSHADLVARGGRYAQMFAVQASAYFEQAGGRPAGERGPAGEGGPDA